MLNSDDHICFGVLLICLVFVVVSVVLVIVLVQAFSISIIERN